MLAGEKRLLETVANGESMAVILEGICLLVESTAAGCHCSVVLVDASGTRFEHGAAPTLPDSFIHYIIGRSVSVDEGPCGMAACLNEQVIADDLTTETRWATSGWCSVALAHGLRACWSTPIPSSAGRVLGTFAIYYEQPRKPTMLEQSLIEQATRDAEGDLLYIGAVQDITPRRLSEFALSKVRSELTHVARVTTLGALTASIAHEVNQPLSGIVTNASTCLRLLGADPPNIEGARETARRTIRDGNRAAEVIARLRALYGGRERKPQPVG